MMEVELGAMPLQTVRYQEAPGAGRDVSGPPEGTTC